MAGNIPGVPNPIPGVTVVEQTISKGASVPAGIRIAAMIGEGATSETIVSAAQGGGKDGFDPSYTTPNGADGRHFKLSLSPIILNRTTLFRNGLPLRGKEGGTDLTSSQFALAVGNSFDYYINTNNGHIQMQTAHLVDQGGLDYKVSSTNVGDGYLAALTISDTNAPSETWTIKCISVQRNGSNAPIAGTAKFIATGTVSGNPLDANGNPIVWVANGQTVTNGVLSFAIYESGPTVVPFREGDSFVVQVSSGVLVKNDSLSATYIPVANINDPEFLATIADVQTKHGLPSTSNTLALGCQLAFANGTPGIMTVQAAPPIPRRTSLEMDPDGVIAGSTNVDDFIFPFPEGVVPDLNSQIHIFVTNPTTNVETQILPNQFPYYELDKSGQPTISEFVFDDANPPAGNSYSYTVIEQPDAEVSGFDGYITGLPGQTSPYTQGIFDSTSIVFDESYNDGFHVLEVLDASNVANNSYYLVTGVSGGKLSVTASDKNGVPLTAFPDFTNHTSVAFQVIDPTTGLPVAGGSAVDGAIVASLGTGTASFTSASTDFTSLTGGSGGILTLHLKINGTVDDNGLYLITANGSTHVVTIAKTVTTESPLRFEVINTNADPGQYLVLNHNVVPDGNKLRITYVDSRDASFYDAGWINALASLETQAIDILVPLPTSTISVIFQNALNHCLTQSSPENKQERVLFIGAINGLTPANLTGAQLAAVEQLGVFEGIPNNDIPTLLAGELSDIANYSVANAFGNTYRCVYFYPDQIVISAGGNNLLVDGFYIAAAAAGYLSGVSNIAIPLTNKTLAGFTILRNKQFSPLVLSQLAQAGVTTLQPVQGGGNVVWGITTTQSGFVEEQEISIVFIRDAVAKRLRQGFKGYIGIAADPTIVETLSARAQALLKSFISQGLITAFSSLNVQQDTVDPTQWDITVAIQPTYPVNFIFIKVSVGLL